MESQKIIIAGKGGQGVKFLSKKLSDLLIEKGYNVLMTLNYDTAITGGDIFSEITFSKNEISEISSEKADFLFLLSEIKENFNAIETVFIKDGSKVSSKTPLNEQALNIILDKLSL